MRSPVRFALLPSLVLAGAVSTPALAGSRRALVVGIDTYPDDPRFRDLAGARADAIAVGAVLRAKYGYEVTLLLDGQATHQGIVDALREKLIEPAEKGDLSVFYYAGHGSQWANSLAPPEQGHREQTIVPSDGRDLPDHLLGQLLVEAAHGGQVKVTAIFDSCHSGNITRGVLGGRRTRAAPIDETDHPWGGARPDPSRVGVITFSAAGSAQSARETSWNGVDHGAFTAAMLDVLQTASVDATHEEVFVRAHALVRAGGEGQDPGLDAPADRRQDPFVSGAARGSGGRPLVAVSGVDGDSVVLDGGRAIGLSPGATLVRKERAGPPLRLTVSEVKDLLSSRATVADPKDGDPKTVTKGEVYEVERWANTAPEPLHIFAGDPLPAARITRVARALRPLRTSTRISWVEDVVAAPTTHVVEYVLGAWRIGGPGGSVIPLGASPTAAMVESKLGSGGVAGAPPPCDRKPCLLVRLPPSSELVAALPWGRSDTDPVVISPPSGAHYALVGRIADQGQELALVLAVSSGGGAVGSNEGGSWPSSLPRRTDWIPATTAAASTLDRQAMKLARVRAWLTVKGTPADRTFPYRLEVLARGAIVGSTGSRAATSTVGATATLGLRLVADPARLGAQARPRYPYVLALDSKGAIDLAYPTQGEADAFPPDDPAARAAPSFRLGGAIRLDGTRGTYTFLLVTTERPLPNPFLLTQTGVVRGASESGSLEAFLSSLGTTSRGFARSTGDWSIDRLEIVAE